MSAPSAKANGGSWIIIGVLFFFEQCAEKGEVMQSQPSREPASYFADVIRFPAAIGSSSFKVKKTGGTCHLTGRNVVSKDGKTLTQTSKCTDAEGRCIRTECLETSRKR
jgi:hypothetical protein